ncbi:hypothetical protein J3R82DRAFT_10373 [Butyriboletus roseoflavus]|nr:hypothetical protein J3R82DRAFT_10373 [Butyriboletus roseoflavus]
MARPLATPSPGDVVSSFVPPPVQRLSRSFLGFAVPPHHSPSDRTSSLPSQSTPPPLPGPNRAPIPDSLYSQSSSSKPSNIFPRLHRLEIADDTTTNQTRTPLLDLKLSSSSFLDAVATDIDSDKPLYAVETVGSSTTIWRSDPWDCSAKIADIRWPKDLPLKGKGRDHTQGATVQMDGPHWRETTSLLKSRGLGSSRKFHIPYHPHALKWKRAGNIYTCTTLTCKGAVATLESFNDADTAPRLKVFETLGSFHRSVPQLDHAGISLSLLDRLFVTALLLVTEPEDWMTIARNPTSLDGQTADAPCGPAFATRASARQWRKVMYGEPLYPSLKTPALDKGTVNGSEDADVLDTSEPPQLSTSIRQWRKIVYGEPLYPSLRPQSVDSFDLPPRPSTATSFSSESAYSSPTPSSAPSTGFYDTPSLFDDIDKAAPRSGAETSQVASPLVHSPGTLSPMPSSECIPISVFRTLTPPGARRELPSPPSSYQPPPSIQPWLHRSRSSPKLSHTQSPMPPADDQDDPINQSLLMRISSGWNVRQLPTPPLRESPIQPPQTKVQPPEARRHSQTHQRSLPPTPALNSRTSSSMTEPHHGHSQSQVVASQYSPISTVVRPSTAQPGPSTPTQNDRSRRARLEKDPDQVITWMRNITRAHRRRAVDEDEDQASGPYEPSYEHPPPAYNAIDFSTPPQARSPPQGARG